MKKLISILIILFLSGCAPQFKPCVNQLFEIHCSQYILRVNDCCDKSSNYSNYLNEQGYNSNVVVGRVNNSKTPHAFVQIKHNGIIYYADPTWSMKVKPKKQWKNRVVNYVYEKNTTADQVRTYQNIKK